LIGIIMDETFSEEMVYMRMALRDAVRAVKK
jgi:hypothetical protein